MLFFCEILIFIPFIERFILLPIPFQSQIEIVDYFGLCGLFFLNSIQRYAFVFILLKLHLFLIETINDGLVLLLLGQPK